MNWKIWSSDFTWTVSNDTRKLLHYVPLGNRLLNRGLFRGLFFPTITTSTSLYKTSNGYEKVLLGGYQRKVLHRTKNFLLLILLFCLSYNQRLFLLIKQNQQKTKTKSVDKRVSLP